LFELQSGQVMDVPGILAIPVVSGILYTQPPHACKLPLPFSQFRRFRMGKLGNFSPILSPPPA
jgi:hypothetical protein